MDSVKTLYKLHKSKEQSLCSLPLTNKLKFVIIIIEIKKKEVVLNEIVNYFYCS